MSFSPLKSVESPEETTKFHNSNETKHELKKNLSAWDSMRANRKVSKISSDALVNIESMRITAKEQIYLTGLSSITAKISSEIISEVMPALAEITTIVDDKMGAIDQTLVNSFTGQVVSHIKNRHENVAEIEALVRDGSMTKEEAEELALLVQQHTEDNIVRSDSRLRHAKSTLETLRKIAGNSIAEIAEDINSNR